MRIVISMFRQILIPLAVVFAVLAGVLMAGVSGLIEYYVLQQWLQTGAQVVMYLPLIIVLSLEGYKLFLHFSDAAFSQNQLSKYDVHATEKYRLLRLYMKWGLVAFSFVCTLIFTANAFYGAVPAMRDEAVKTEEERIEEYYAIQFEKDKETIEQSYQEALAAAHEKVDSAQEYFNSIQIVYTPRYQYERTTAQKEEAREALVAAQKDYISAQTTARAEYERSVEELRDYNKQLRDKELADSEVKFHTVYVSIGDNPYLNSFLLAFSETFFQRTYSRTAYFIWVFFISLALAALMEGVISLSQYVVTMPASVLQEISKTEKLGDDEKQRMTRVVAGAVNVLAAIAVFLLFGAFQEVSYNKMELGAAFLCSVMTALIPPVVTAISVNRDESKFSKTAKIVGEEVRALIIKSLLSFSLFVLIGVFFGENFSALSVPAAGIALGNMVGHTLHLVPGKTATA